MKKSLKYFLGAAFLGALVLVAAVVPASADQISFGCTNQIFSTDAVMGYPTNATGPGVGGVGKPINVRKGDVVGLYITAHGTNTTNGAWTIELVRGWGTSVPTVSYSTNGLRKNNWESLQASGITIATPLMVAAGSETNLDQVYFTNLNSTVIGQCDWIGIKRITNAMACSWFTNFDVGLITKSGNSP